MQHIPKKKPENIYSLAIDTSQQKGLKSDGYIKNAQRENGIEELKHVENVNSEIYSMFEETTTKAFHDII